MVAEKTYLVKGHFEGHFKMEENPALISSDKSLEPSRPKIRIYRGIVSHTEELSQIDLTEINDDFSFQNIGNIQINTSNKWPIKNDRIYHIHEMKLLNAEITETYQLNNATYGIIRGEIVGKVQPRNTLDLSGNDKIDPPISNTTQPENEDKTNNQKTPIIPGTGNRGCLPGWTVPSRWLRWLWILLAVLLLLWLLERCSKLGQKLICKYEEGEYRTEWEHEKAENDTLQAKIDSLNLDEEGHFVDADYLIITYYFDANSGLDLDTRTQLINPNTSRILGFGFCDNNEFEGSGELSWAGDNRLDGAESCMIDLRQFSKEEIIQVECSAIWWVERRGGDILLDIRAYKGGTVFQMGREFVNSGGVQKGYYRYPDNIRKKMWGKNKRITGQYIGTVTYNKEINYLSLDKY